MLSLSFASAQNIFGKVVVVSEGDTVTVLDAAKVQPLGLPPCGRRWKSLQEMDHLNPGFDVEAVTFEGNDEVIEGLGPWLACSGCDSTALSHCVASVFFCLADHEAKPASSPVWLHGRELGATGGNIMVLS